MGKIYHGGYDDAPSWSVPWTSPRTGHGAYGRPENLAIVRAKVEASKKAPQKKGGGKVRNYGPAFESSEVPDNIFHDGALGDVLLSLSCISAIGKGGVLPDVVCRSDVGSSEAFQTARLCLADSLACGLEALQYPHCARMLGPVVPGATLSGGERSRLELALLGIMPSNLLLLDEPTNHLDIDTILWLEEFLLKSVKTLVFVTHDRAFARRIANRTAEIDRGRLYAFACGYLTSVSATN